MEGDLRRRIGNDCQRSWIKQDLRSDPANLRIMHVEGDSMMPTFHDGDIVLVDLGRRSPTPPGIFVLHDGMDLVFKRLEHIPNSDPPRFGSSPTIRSTSRTKAAGTRQRQLDGYAGSRARCDHYRAKR
jgi:hypothetical protein